ncbi:MAG: polysaccharide deacetylase family protein [Candidatus Sumerlaeia bacterium]
MPQDFPMIPIFMYHALRSGPGDTDPHLSDPAAQPYILSLSDFNLQTELMTILAAKSALSWNSIIDNKSFVLSFDDGHRSNAELALPVLAQKNLKAAFLITTDWIGRPGYMAESQIRELAQAGMLIGSHGRSHRYLSDLADAELDDELRGSRARLEDLLGIEVPAMSLPGGRSNARVRERVAAAGYKILMTSRIGLASAGDDPLDLPRVPVTNRLGLEFFKRLLAGDDSDVRRMARSARIRDFAKSILGNQLYDCLRVMLIRK